MNKKLKIILPIFIVLIVILNVVLFRGQSTILINSKDEAIKHIQKLNTAIIEGGTKAELSKLIGTNKILGFQNIEKNDLPNQKDYDIVLMSNISDYIKDLYSNNLNYLEKYVKVSSLYADNLEKTIKQNFSFKLRNISEVNGKYMVYVTYKTYYYFPYLMDLAALQNDILDKLDIDFEKETDEEIIITNAYKARIKAASILDKHLNNYINKEETKTILIEIKKGKIENSSDSLKSYLINLNGYAYKNDNLSNLSNQRVKQYLSQLNSNNILEL